MCNKILPNADSILYGSFVRHAHTAKYVKIIAFHMGARIRDYISSFQTLDNIDYNQ